MSRLTYVPIVFSLVAAACSPTTSGVNQNPLDLAPSERDLGRDCSNPIGNLVSNPSFESGDGTAINTPPPDSTIASWTGCCGTGGTTTWTISTTSPYCGTRSAKVASQNAVAHVLLETFNRPSDAAKQFVLTGHLFVTALDAAGSVKLDLWDLTTNQVVATTLALTTPTSDWRTLSQSGSIPQGGNYQVRINSTGNVEAYVDDVSLVIP